MQRLKHDALTPYMDPTEGALATGTYELAVTPSLGATVEESKIPISFESGKICEVLGLDPLRVITSGALLLTLTAKEKEIFRKTLIEKRVRWEFT